MSSLIASLALLVALGAGQDKPPADQAPAPGPSSNLEEMLRTGGRVSGPELGRRVAEAQRHPLGSRENPVRVNMPQGQRAYLSRLRCSDGSAPAFQRTGNLGPGVYGSIVDAYDVRCAAGEPRQSVVVMDMYHGDYRETQAVPGFTLADDPNDPRI